MRRRHEAQDHVPYRKGCPICVAAQGRQTSHRRAAVVGVYAASFDIAGPFISGRSFDPVSSGRDRGLGYKYFLACAFTIPLQPIPPEEKSDAEIPAGDAVALVGAEAPDEPCLVVEPVLEDGISVEAVRVRVRGKRPEDPEDDMNLEGLFGEEPPLPPPSFPPPEEQAVVGPVSTRTLFLGVPLRSKKGREVFGAVQALINRLESFGCPVHRYHADRAQELKSKALVSWLRDRGIHGTWTPGDTPAGNKAELAVQNLKGVARKLLLVAKLDPSYWPLAVLHASNRNWVSMCEVLGIPCPVLLPFGLLMEARCRVKTGYPAHWRQRTVSGLYLGQAPDTPGGHLVLVDDKERGSKVLLTNTVYPVRVGDEVSKKPKYRIRGKLAPELVLRYISAVQFVSSPEVPCPDELTRFAPGGESHQFSHQLSDSSGCSALALRDSVFEEVASEFGMDVEEQIEGIAQNDSALEDRLQSGCALWEQQQVGIAPSEQQVTLCRQQVTVAPDRWQRQDNAPGEPQGLGHGQPVGLDIGARLRFAGLSHGLDGFIEGQHPEAVIHCDEYGEGCAPDRRENLPQGRDGTRVSEDSVPGFTSMECLEGLRNWWSSRGSEPGDFAEKGNRIVLGVVPNEAGRWSDETGEASDLVQGLNGFLRKSLKDLSWTTLLVSLNRRVEGPELALEVKGSSVGVAIFGMHQGGGLWIQVKEGKGPVIRRLKNGALGVGHVGRLRKALFSWILTRDMR